MIDFKAKIDYSFLTDERILLTRIKNLMSGEVFTIKSKFEKIEEASTSRLEFIPIIDTFSSDTSSLISNEQFIQGVLDAAWEAGFRPIGFKDIQRETGALQNHLDDMRRLVFKDRFEVIKKTNA